MGFYNQKEAKKGDENDYAKVGNHSIEEGGME